MSREPLSRSQPFLSNYTGDHNVTMEVRFGTAAVEIINAATHKKAELIVLTSHGRTGLPHLLIGSVAERVTRIAHCPVLILRT